MADGFLQPAPQQGTLGKIGLGLQAFGAGVQGRGPEFLALQQQQGQALSLERQKAAAEDLRRAQLLFKKGDIAGIRALAEERVGHIQQLGGDPVDTIGIMNLAEASLQGNEASRSSLGNLLDANVELAAGQGLIKLPQPPKDVQKFESVRDEAGNIVAQRNITTGEVKTDPRAKPVDGADASFTRPLEGLDEEGNPIFFTTDKTGSKLLIKGVKPIKGTNKIETANETIIVDKQGNIITRFDKNIGAAETEKIIAGEAAKYKAGRIKTLPEARASANSMVSVIDKMIGSEDGTIPEHRGLRASVGPIDATFKSRFPAAIAFDTLADQLQGKAFLEAFQKLKGGGTITEVEGTKAEQSMARTNKSQDEEDYISGLKELRTLINDSVLRHEAEASDDGLTPSQRAAEKRLRNKGLIE